MCFKLLKYQLNYKLSNIMDHAYTKNYIRVIWRNDHQKRMMTECCLYNLFPFASRNSKENGCTFRRNKNIFKSPGYNK